MSVFGHVAVLFGHVTGAARKKAIERWVQGQKGVERVVNKIRVGP